MTPTQRQAMEQARNWIAERPEDRKQSAGAIVALLNAALAETAEPVALLVAQELERVAQDPPVNGNQVAQGRVLMTAKSIRDFGLSGGAAPQPPAPAVRYDVLYEYAAANRLSYNELCRTVHTAIAAHEAKRGKV